MTSTHSEIKQQLETVATNRQTPYLITGRLHERSPRHADFTRVFGSDLVPLREPVTQLANVPGLLGAEVYLLDVNQLTDEQKERLYDFLSERFGTPRADVPAILFEEGMPILAKDVTVYVGLGLFL